MAQDKGPWTTPLAAALVCAGLGGCAQVPELDARIPDLVQHGQYPVLVPLDRALSPLPAPGDQAARLAAALAGRRDALQARARRLQTPVVDEPDRRRMAEGVSP